MNTSYRFTKKLAIILAIITICFLGCGKEEKEDEAGSGWKKAPGDPAKTTEEAYYSFVLLMNKIAGSPASWSAIEHEMNEGVLTVKGVTLKINPDRFFEKLLEPSKEPQGETLPASASGSSSSAASASGKGGAGENTIDVSSILSPFLQKPDSDASASSSPLSSPREISLNIEEISVTEILKPNALGPILAPDTYDSSAESAIATGIRLKGASLDLDLDLDPDMPEEINAKFKLEEADIVSPSLSPALPDTQPGLKGFLRNFKASSVSHKGFEVAFTPPAPDDSFRASFSIKSSVSDNLSFAGPIGSKPNASFIEVILSYSASEASSEGMSAKFDLYDSAISESINVIASCDSYESSGIKGFQNFDYAKVSPFSLSIETNTSEELSQGSKVSFASAEIKGLDATESLLRYISLFRIKLKQENFDLIKNLFSITDLFVYSSDLTSVSIDDFNLGIDNGFKLEAHNLSFEGPVKAGLLSDSKTSVKGIKIRVPDFAEGPVWNELQTAARILGSRDIEMEIDLSTDYDEESDVTKLSIDRLDVQNNFKFSAYLSLDGFNQKLFNDLSKIRISGSFLKFFAIRSVRDMGLKELNLTYEDMSFLPRIYKYFASKKGSSALELQNASYDFLYGFFMFLGDFDYYYDKNLNPYFFNSLQSFIEEPKRLVFSAKPDIPLKYDSLSLTGEYLSIADLLGLQIQANDMEPQKMLVN